jgi:hypothetical protein
MKKLVFLILVFASSNAFTQAVFESVPFVKAEFENQVIDTSIFRDLDKFNDENDAIVYIYRLKSMVGAAVKWQIIINTTHEAFLKQKEYFLVHLDTRQKEQVFYFPGTLNMIYKYINFKPNTYYYVMLKGFDRETGYLNEKTLKELNTCKISKSVQK